MRRGWFVLLALSLGLNAGLLFVHYSRWNKLPEFPSREVMGREEHGERGAPGERAELGPMDRPGGAESFIRDRIARAGEKLDLSEDQIKSMSEILDAVMPEMMVRRDHIRELRMQMRDEYIRPEVDVDRIQALRQETEFAQSKLDSIMVETMLKESHILTPDQREAYFQLMPFGERGGHGARMRRGRRWQNN